MMAETTTRNLIPGDWQQRLETVVAMMRQMSTHTDPQEMVQDYTSWMRKLMPVDATLSLSRRGLEPPFVRITRSSRWDQSVNPWKQPHQLPVIEGGLLAELIYGNRPRIINDLHVPEDDPAASFLEGQRSLQALPLFDKGEALNMVISMKKEPDTFSTEMLPETVWMANLFGRATHNLVLAEKLDTAYTAVDRELRAVADIQRSLLPRVLPDIPHMKLAAFYETSQRAGGDYYDFFPLPDGKWGLLIADVSGHGTPAAVMMAITHSIAHMHPGPPTPPGNLLTYLNSQLHSRYTAESGAFVTAFYGIFDPATRELTYSSAGHNPPRVKRCRDGGVIALDGAGYLPLGVLPDSTYEDATHTLLPGDRLLLYTDGIIEAQNPQGELFGLPRLDLIISDCGADPQLLMDRILTSVRQFTAGRPASDDRTLVVASIS